MPGGMHTTDNHAPRTEGSSRSINVALTLAIDGMCGFAIRFFQIITYSHVIFELGHF